MTAPDVDDALAERIGALVDARPDLDDTAALALAQALAVPCGYCGAAAGDLCVRSDGGPLEHFLAHELRIRTAGARLGFTDPRWLGGGAKPCRDADPQHGCPTCHPPRSRTADAWPDVPPPDGPGDDQGWRR